MSDKEFLNEINALTVDLGIVLSDVKVILSKNEMTLEQYAYAILHLKHSLSNLEQVRDILVEKD